MRSSASTVDECHIASNEHSSNSIYNLKNSTSPQKTSERPLVAVALSSFIIATVVFFLITRCNVQIRGSRKSTGRKLANGSNHQWPSLRDLCAMAEDTTNPGNSSASAEPPSENQLGAARSQVPVPSGHVPASPSSFFDFPEILGSGANGGAKHVLQSVLTHICDMRSYSGPRSVGPYARVFGTTYAGVFLRIFVEHDGVTPSWPRRRALEKLGRRLQRAVLLASSDAVHSAYGESMARTCSIGLTYPWGERGRVTVTVVAEKPWFPSRAEGEEVEFYV